ncbi:hypothetical protein LTR16_005422, partial [Cryomyces antarcticus]
EAPFLRLPTEIRNRICNLAFGAPRVIANRSNYVQPSITQVRKQIRDECLPIYYGRHELQGRIWILLYWLRRTNCMMLRYLKFLTYGTPALMPDILALLISDILTSLEGVVELPYSLAVERPDPHMGRQEVRIVMGNGVPSLFVGR